LLVPPLDKKGGVLGTRQNASLEHLPISSQLLNQFKPHVAPGAIDLDNLGTYPVAPHALSAEKRYRAFKESALYNQEAGLWYDVISTKGRRPTAGPKQAAITQLLGVLVEYLLETGNLNGLSDIFVKS